MSAIVIGDYVVGPIASSLLTGLIAFWKLGEASGTRSDSVGSNHLADNNTVTQAAGKIGNAAQFTAVNQEWLNILISGSDLLLSNQNFTLSCWIYLDTSQVSVNWLDQRPGFSLYTLSSTPRLFIEGTGSAEAVWGSALSTSTWYHIACWHEQGTGVSISVNNGTPVFTSYAGGIINTATYFNIGAYSDGSAGWIDGRVDAVGIWHRLLTADERTALYNGGAGIEYPFS